MRLHKTILKLYKKSLKIRRNVVGLGTGYKIKQGKITNIPCILVGVSRKQTLQDLDKKDVIPKKIIGIETDVLEVGELRYMNEWRKKHRPLKLGASMCWEGLSACSLGLPLWIKDILPHAPSWVKEEFKTGDLLYQNNKHCTHPDENRGIWKEGDLLTNPSPLDGGTKEDGFAELTKLFFPVSYKRKDNIDVSWCKGIKGIEALTEDVAGRKYIKGVRKLIEKMVPYGDILKTFTGGSRNMPVRESSPILSVDFDAMVWGYEDGKDIVREHPNCVLALNVDKDGNHIVLGGCSSSIRYIDELPLVQIFAGSTTVAVGNQVYLSIKYLRDKFGIKVSLEPLRDKFYVAAGEKWYIEPQLGKTKTKVNLNLRTEPRVHSSTLIRTLPKGTEIEVLDVLGRIGGYEWVEIKLCNTKIN